MDEIDKSKYPPLPAGRVEADYRYLPPRDALVIGKNPHDRRWRVSVWIVPHRATEDKFFREDETSGWLDYVMRDDAAQWFTDRGIRYKADIDRGDWGEGAPRYAIQFTNARDAQRFYDEFNETIYQRVLSMRGREKLISECTEN